MTTRTQMEAYVAGWVPRLGLGHWNVKIDWTRGTSDDENATITFEDDYDAATIRFCAEYATWTQTWAEWVVVHELMHLVLRDLHVAVEASHEPLPAAARRVADVMFMHELEGVVDRVSGALVALAPLEDV